MPWIPGATLSNTNEEPSRKCLHDVERKVRRSEKLRIEYDNIVHEQINQGIVEKVPEHPMGERRFYMPHKPVVRETPTSTKVRMVFDASAKPHPGTSQECLSEQKLVPSCLGQPFSIISISNHQSYKILSKR